MPKLRKNDGIAYLCSEYIKTVSYTHLDVYKRQQYAYRSGMSAQEFTQWQDGVRAAMVEIIDVYKRQEPGSSVLVCCRAVNCLNNM